MSDRRPPEGSAALLRDRGAGADESHHQMNGRDLAGRLASIRPGLACLFMSGHSAEIITRDGMLDEDVRFLQKPFTRSDLAVAVHEALARHRTPGAA